MLILEKQGSPYAAALAFGLPILLLAPFITKAFHIDDPFYVWVGQHIVSHPSDFYGFPINWTGTEAPAAMINRNPPLVSYYMALVSPLTGWSEVGMHLAFLLPAALAGLGIYRLAERFCTRPLFAVAAAILSPAFLVSASNVMAEVMMLCFYVWALELWLRGLESNRFALLTTAATLIGLSTLSKYFGVSLIPLLFAYTLAEKRMIGKWVLPLSIPIVIILAYELLTLYLYGQAHLFEAASYANLFREQQAAPTYEKLLTGLVFVGGCISVPFFFLPWLWSRKVLAVGIALVAAVFGVFALSNTFLADEARDESGALSWAYAGQFSLFAVAGVFVLGLAVSDLWKERDTKALLLFLWVAGTFLFATQVNWTTNARSVLPMAAPVAMLLVRRLDARGRDRSTSNWQPWVALAPAAVLTIVLLVADFRLANSAREAARSFREDMPAHDGATWYLGHWGFQYYMELGDAQHVDVAGTEVSPGDVLVIPINNMRKLDIPEIYTHAYSTEFDILPWLSTWNYAVGAGFYSDTWGHLPFAFGRVPKEQYSAILIAEPATLRWKELDTLNPEDYL